jgi:hypothetical protein
LNNQLTPSGYPLPSLTGNELVDLTLPPTDPITSPYFTTATTQQIADLAAAGASKAFATIASLAATAIPAAAAYAVVTDPLRGGIFAWSALNLSAFVTADIGQAIYVAPASAPTGVSGAWVRQYTGPVNFSWFGGVGDANVTLGPPNHTIFGDYRSSYTTIINSAGTDNSAAFNNFLPWARNEAANGRAVAVECAPGSYCFDLANFTFPGFYGINQLDFNANGAVFTNTNSGDTYLSNPWLFQCSPFVTGPSWAGDGVIPAGGSQPIAFLINTTAVGDLSVTLQTAARTSYFYIGEWVFIGSYDIQMSGYPPNMYYGDYAQITSINKSTGVIGLTTPLKYAHRSDFNDYFATGLPYNCGAARIWKLDTTGYGYAIPVPWDIEHTYRNIQVNMTPNFTAPGFYTVFSGRKLITSKWKGAGFSQTIMMEGVHENDHFWTLPETDKNIGSILYKSCQFDFTDGAQSSSVERITYEDCDIGGISIGAKETVLINTTVKPNIQSTNFNLSASQGQAGPATFINSKLVSYVPAVIFPSVLDAGSALNASSDGSTPITFSNGTLILNKSTGQSLLPSFIGVPGQYVALKPVTNPGFAGNIGVGVVIRMRSDSTNVYIDTTLQLASLPSWSLSGVAAQFNIFRATSTTFINCNGSDQARMVSDACANGFDYWNWKSYTFNGSATGGNLAGWLGSMLWADIDVVWPSASGSDVIIFSYPTYTFNGSAFVADSGGSQIQINCGVKGHRFLSKTMFMGQTGTDSITVGGSASAFLPTGRTIADVAQWSASPFGSQIDLTPLIKATFAFDTGQARKLLTTNFNRTSSGMILPTIGLLV